MLIKQLELFYDLSARHETVCTRLFERCFETPE